ncbi:MAG: hypothetical protein IT529_02190 [Burkholderiales bacterium]|nr:hypothetical protein [Burkholderiales bacterium]
MLRIVLIALLLAGCAELPQSPADVQARRFEPVPGKAVIYIVRTPLDSEEMGGLVLDDGGQITTFGGTYYRWETAPGAHRVTGLGAANVTVTLDTAPGGIYFVQHTVTGTRRSGPQNYRLTRVGEQEGRAMVARSTLLR